MSKETEVSRRDFLRIVGYFIASSPLTIPGKIFLDDILGKDEPETALNPLPTPKPEEIQPTSTLPVQERSPARVETGIDLLELMDLRDKVIYIVYGRPQKHGVPMWGSLGLTQTAEESWAIFQARKEGVSRRIGKNEEEFALNVINPVYYNDGDPIKDIYVAKALELAPERQGLVALGFNDINLAYTTVDRLTRMDLPREKLARLAISFDAEHFPRHQVDARAINQFTAWFGQKHQEWAGRAPIPGLVMVYTFALGIILNKNELIQYYPDQKTLVAPVFDGYGTLSAKKREIRRIIRDLPNTEDFPALLGAMEFRLRWGDTYDKCTVKETFSTLEGQPVFFLASQ